MLKHIMQYIGRIIGLAAAYYIGGRLGLLLQIPPGQATAFWPPSGIALAGLLACGPRCWPGVFIGAVGTSLSHADVIGLADLRLAAVIAAGASLQAVLGALLVRRAIGTAYVLERVRDILKLILMGGVLACLINAVIATLALKNAGIVPAAAVLPHGFTWWAGDVLGVIVFAPVMLLVMTPAKGRIGVTMRRKVTVALSMMLVFGMVVYLFMLTRDQYKAALQEDFVQNSERIAMQFERELSVYMTTLLAVEGFFAASDYVTADEYARFTSRFFDRAPGFSGISWLPRVLHEDRADFEKSIREQGFPDYEIRRRFDLGRMGRSEKRDFYFPIAYTAPYERNKVALGLDVYGKDPLGMEMRHAALKAARDTGEAHATARFRIVQDERSYGFIIYVPCYGRPDTALDSVEARRDSLKGFVNGVFVLPRLMRSITQSAAAQGMHVILRDRGSNGDDNQLIYDSRTPDFEQGAPDSYDHAGRMHYIHNFDMAGRLWEMTLLADPQATAVGMNWGLWAVALGGVLYCGLFGVFILVITARTAVVERRVAHRTEELARANAELEEFAYRTSHDLRSPIISSQGLLEVARDALDERDTGTVRASLEHTRNALGGLNSLIEDILLLTEVNKREEQPQEVDFEALLKQALDKLAHMEGFDRLSVAQDLQFDGALRVKKLRLRVILENLLSNAVKYQDKARTDSFIRIETRREGDNFILKVTDNGLGIPKGQQDKLFGMFNRFHTRVSFGSGLGLYLVQKSATALGGDVVFEDPGEGAAFIVRIPAGERR